MARDRHRNLRWNFGGLAAGAADDQAAAADAMAGEWEPLIGPLVEGLASEIAEATSLEEVRSLFQMRLEGLSSEELGEQLARAVFAARISGEAGEDLN